MEHKYTYKRDMVDKRDHRFSDTIAPHSEIILPKSVDLRSKCPPVYDQGDLGSCTANAGCACRSILMNDQQVTLSRLFLYYIERGLRGDLKNDSGASLRDTCNAMYDIGVCEEKYMPYDVKKYTHQPPLGAIVNADKYRIVAYKSLSNLDEIKQNLAFRQQPAMIGMDVYEGFESDIVAKTGIMPMPREDEKKLGGHAVLVVGYRDITKKYGMMANHQIKTGHLIVRNSWGSDWGHKGYFYMPYEYVVPEYTYDYWMIE